MATSDERGGGGRPTPPRRLPPVASDEPRLIRRMLAGLRGPDEGAGEPPLPPQPDAQAWIRSLGLRAHPEGGFHRETFRAPERLTGVDLPERFEAPRALCSASYLLLEGQQRWLIQRLTSHQVWHFLDGDPLVLHVFAEGEELRRITLGRAVAEGQTLQAVVPASTWFGATLAEGSAYALVGATFTPGLDSAEVERGERRVLLERYPRHQTMVKRLTR